MNIKKNFAFTFFEILIVLIIISIMSFLGLPHYHFLFEQTTNQILQSQLTDIIQFARTEASARNLPIVICKSSDGNRCGGEWGSHMIVFINENEDGILIDRSKVLMVMQLKAHSGFLHWRSFPIYHTYILFNPKQREVSDNGTFWFCPQPHAQVSWALTLNKKGQTKLYQNKNGNIKDNHGRILTCDQD